jgi:GTP cyclohydrolase I
MSEKIIKLKTPASITVKQSEAEAAIRTLLEWAGDNPDRDGLSRTPERVAKSYRELFSGYQMDPAADLATTFENTAGYKGMVTLTNIHFTSMCEHHILPIVGTAHVAYEPSDRIVGLSKLARVVEAFARRLQVQEKMTEQIAQTIYETLEPKGVAVIIQAEHFCMSMRGVNKQGSTMATRSFLGSFKDNKELREEFLNQIDLA